MSVKKFEFQTVQLWAGPVRGQQSPETEFLDKLNKLGQDGWEAVGIMSGAGGQIVVLLQREKDN